MKRTVGAVAKESVGVLDDWMAIDGVVCWLLFCPSAGELSYVDLVGCDCRMVVGDTSKGDAVVDK